MPDLDQRPALLVFEPDVVRAQLLLAILSEGGIPAQHASDLAQAVELVGEGRCDVTVVGMGVRHPKGLELVRHLREADPDSVTRILAVIVPDEEDVEARAREVGVDAFVSEPYDPSLLQKLVRELSRKAA